MLKTAWQWLKYDMSFERSVYAKGAKHKLEGIGNESTTRIKTRTSVFEPSDA